MTSNGFRSARCLVLALLLAIPARSQVNDDWQNAIAITNGITAGSTAGATTGNPIGACGQMGSDVWYSYVATCTGVATATTCSPGAANFDTVIATWFAPLPCGAPRPGPISCNDDSCFPRSTATFAVIAGHTYYISVGGYAGATGAFNLLMSCLAAAGPPPANNLCANALTVNHTTLLTGTNVGATSGAGDPVGTCGAMGNDVWYSFVVPETKQYVVTTCLPGTDFDTVIAVWAGAGCGSLVQIGCNDDGCYPGGPGLLKSTVTFNATAGATYHVSVGGFSGAIGYFNLRVNPVGPMILFITSVAPGNIGFGVTGGPPNGTYFAAFTLNGGNFPNGWFLGIDIGALELGQELGGGPPFWGALGPCGIASVGPYSGLPPGLAVYGVAVGFTSAAGPSPVVISAPDSAVVQ